MWWNKKTGECTHPVFSSRRNVAANSSQTVPFWDNLARSHAITGFQPISFPYNPLQLSHFGTLSFHPYLPVRILQSQVYQGFTRSRPHSIKRWHSLCPLWCFQLNYRWQLGLLIFRWLDIDIPLPRCAMNSLANSDFHFPPNGFGALLTTSR